MTSTLMSMMVFDEISGADDFQDVEYSCMSSYHIHQYFMTLGGVLLPSLEKLGFVPWDSLPLALLLFTFCPSSSGITVC